MRLKAWELRALFAVDRAYLLRCGELAAQQAGGQEVASEPLTGDLFDKLFK